MFKLFKVSTLEQNAIITLIVIGNMILLVFFCVWLRKWRKETKQNASAQKSEGQVYKEVSDKLAFLDFVCLLSMDERGFIIAITNGLSNLLHWQKEELIGKNAIMLVPNDFKDVFKKEMDNHRTYGSAEYLDTPIQCTVLKKGNVETPAEIIIDKKQDAGKTYFVVKIRDLSRYNTELGELKRKINFYRNGERMIKMGLFEWDFPNDAVDPSEGFREIFSLPPYPVKIHSDSTMPMIAENDQLQLRKVIATAIEQHKPFYEAEFTLKNGWRIKVYADIKYMDGAASLITGALRVINKP